MNKSPATAACFLAAVALALLAAGCTTVGPDYRAPSSAELGVPAAWPGTSPARAPAQDDLAAWWQRLGDPTLTTLVTRALAGNRDLASATSRLREARARRDLAVANGFPTLRGSASVNRTDAGSQHGGGSTTSYDAGFDASWEPDLFGGQRRGVEAAQADVAAAADDLGVAHVSLAAEVARNYLDVRSLQARLAIARASLDTQSQTLQLTQWRAQAGLTTSLDVEQATAAVEQTRAQIPALETALANARNRIAVLAGVAPGTFDALLVAPEPLPALPASIAIGIPADTLRQRPDLRAAERRLAAETARIGQQTAALYPSLGLAGTLGLQSLTFAGLTQGGATVSQLAASLAATIFDAGRVRSQIDIQTAVQERALAQYQGAVLTALEDVENALVALDNAERRRVSLATAVAAARNAALLAEQRYTAGITDFQTVLDTQRTLLAVQETLAMTEDDRMQALVQLYKALGGGWTPEATNHAAQAAAPKA